MNNDKQFFIKNDKGEWVLSDKEEAYKQDLYGEGDLVSGHIFAKHTRCDITGCPICELSYCAKCGAFEGALTTECCEEHLDEIDIRDIYSGKMDYRYGQWLEGVTNKGMVWSKETTEENNQALFSIFDKDIYNRTELGLQVLEDIELTRIAWSIKKKVKMEKK